MRIFYGITYGVDVRLACLQVFVHLYAAHFTQFEPGIPRQLGVGADTDTEYHYVGLYLAPRGKFYLNAAVGTLEGCHGLFKIEPYPFFKQVAVYD